MFQIEFDTKEIEGALPDYKYIKRLGSGAFATVHLVQKRQTGEQFALKKVSCFGMGEYQKAGAANQARILSSLDHKNIIKVYSCLFDNTQDILYIFMQYADSGDLNELIQQAKQKKKRIPENTIWKAISDISDGLLYIHKSQVIHRDLKPANIFRVGKNFKIGDMNVSKVVKNGAIASTKTGSPLYSAPEIWQSEEYCNKCDIWSLGALIYEMCSLKVPYEAESIIQLTNKMKNTKPKSLPTIYSSALDDVVKRMLTISPQKRIELEQVYKIASQKLKLQTENLDQNGVDSLMNTIVFPDTHQRWVNLIPSLPPKTSRKEGSSSEIRERNVKSKDKKQEKSVIENNSCIFRSAERRPINLPKSRSRSKIQNKPDLKAENKGDNKMQLNAQLKVAAFPPIYRLNSPMNQRKQPQQKTKSSEKRQTSSSSRQRKSIIEFVNETKSMINNNEQ